MLSPVSKSKLLEALLRSWMLGKHVAVDADITEAYAELWPEYLIVLQEHTALREKRAELGRLGNERRWPQKGSPDDRKSDPLASANDSQKGSQNDRNSDPLAIAKESQEGSPGDRTRVDRTPTPTPTITQTIPPTPTTPISLPAAETQRETWITPYVEAWNARTGGEMVVDKALRPLGKLRKKHGDDAVLDAWDRYLRMTEVRYCSVHDFAAKYGQWAGTAEPPRSRESEILRQLVDEGPVDPFEANWAVRKVGLLS